VGDEYEFICKPGHKFEHARSVIAAYACTTWGHGVAKTSRIITPEGEQRVRIRRQPAAASPQLTLLKK
jgi:hypothetical protein